MPPSVEGGVSEADGGRDIALFLSPSLACGNPAPSSEGAKGIKANHLSQKEIAKLLGIGVGTISEVEKMQLPKNLGARIVIDLALSFHISVDDLMKKRLDNT